MMNWFEPVIDAPFLLEMLNGGAITPELLWLVLLARYLTLESQRRGLHGFDWFSLPPSMNLVLAIFICDTGVWLRSVTLWAWRRFEVAGDFNSVQFGLLILGDALIVIGYLCKVRAITYPDFGNKPWLIAGALSTTAIAALLVLR